MEQVRVCRFCGHLNATEGPTRCDNCGFFSGLTTLARPEGEQLGRRQRLRFLRSRFLRLALVLGPVAGLAVWVMWGLFDLAPNPPGATTSISASIGPQTWAQARRTPQNTGFTPDPAPVPQKVLWTYASSRPLVTSPAVANDRVFLTTGDGRTVALDRQTGQLVWEYQTGIPSSSTPALAGGSVFFALRPGLVVALDQETGSFRWERDIKQPILASPVVANGTLYIGAAADTLYALDAATGVVRWAFNTSDWIISSVAYTEGTVVVTSQDNIVRIVETKTGRQLFLYDTGRRRRISTGGPAIQGDLVYFGSRGGRVWAIDLRAKTYPLERTIFFWKTNLYLWGVLPKPPVQKGSVWAKNIGGDVTQTPAIGHDKVYATNNQGKVIALDVATGTERWTTELGVEITAAPTVAGETVLIGTKDGMVIGLDAVSGIVLWDFKTDGKITGSPIVVGDEMYVVSHDGNLYAVAGAE